MVGQENNIALAWVVFHLLKKKRETFVKKKE